MKGQRIDPNRHIVTERLPYATEETTRSWTSNEFASFLDGWSFARLGYPLNRENAFFMLGVECAGKAVA